MRSDRRFFPARETGCGTQGRSPRLSLAPSHRDPAGVEPERDRAAPLVSMRSATGICERHAKPAGTCATIASTVSQAAGKPFSSLTIATRLPRAV